MVFDKESAFEEAVIKVLKQHGWDDAGGVLMYPTEQDLLDNWAKILLQNNSGIDRLNGVPLTQGEMAQIIEQIELLRTPVALNGFINGKTVAIKRDNPDDPLHIGKEVSLKIYDRKEIAAGQSRYQIARQPKYKARSWVLPDRRGDLCLLINGMPVIHIELKRSGIPVSQACDQIKKYAHEGIFTGLFALVQIFVAMTPEESLYFANPGAEEFNPAFYFHWADYNNEPINDWKRFAASLLSIPMAHQLIGFYTVADSSDGALKVLRSYQYYAASGISDVVRECKWDDPIPKGSLGRRGGFVWHTTGSGKTMTSFKAAQLVADSKDADKVLFLQDRIELGTQTLREYRGFADDSDDIQATENTEALKTKIASPDPKNTLIVTSIQKMSNIKPGEGKLTEAEIASLADRRIVMILDECHRSVFGDMLADIRHSFPGALYFGFTGTPIFEENRKNDSTTAMIFGNEIHRYSIADGIRDKNVLGFDPYQVFTFKDKDIRHAVALEQAKAKTFEEVIADPKKSEIYYKYMDGSQVPMAGFFDKAGKYVKGIEDYVSAAQYAPETDHPNLVVDDIIEQFPMLSRGGVYHALFATSSIPEAINYYHLFKEKAPHLKVTALFDPSIDNVDGADIKEDALKEIIEDYDRLFDKKYTIPSWQTMKKDISARLAHKEPYLAIAKEPDKCIDILIVVDQMLTGFDSKWVNTLYADKMFEYESVIQAFSRTNRLHAPEKPFGIIRYYRKPHTMDRNIAIAVKAYSGDKPLQLFVQKLPENIKGINDTFAEIKAVFAAEGIEDFVRLPEGVEAKQKFAKEFVVLNKYLEAAKVQGFYWGQLEYEFPQDDGSMLSVTCELDENTYLILALRYRELFEGGESSGNDPDVPYEIDGYLVEIDTGKIDADYMNANFVKWLKALGGEEEQAASEELHRSFASLTKEEQKYAELFLHDVERGDVALEDGVTLRDYITRYIRKAKDAQLLKIADRLGVDLELLEEMASLDLTENNINEFGRFDRLKDSMDKAKAKAFFEEKTGASMPQFKVNMEAFKLLRKFILDGSFDIDE